MHLMGHIWLVKAQVHFSLFNGSFLFYISLASIFQRPKSVHLTKELCRGITQTVPPWPDPLLTAFREEIFEVGQSSCAVLWISLPPLQGIPAPPPTQPNFSSDSQHSPGPLLCFTMSLPPKMLLLSLLSLFLHRGECMRGSNSCWEAVQWGAP